MSGVTHRARLTTLVACAGIASGSCGPHHTCKVSGTAILPTDQKTVCAVELYIGNRDDALFSQPISSGQRFELLVSVPIVEPAFEHHTVVRCPGYPPEPSKAFKLGEGWGSCRSVDLGDIRIGPAKVLP